MRDADYISLPILLYNGIKKKNYKRPKISTVIIIIIIIFIIANSIGRVTENGG